MVEFCHGGNILSIWRRCYEDLKLTMLKHPLVCLVVPVCKLAYRELKSNLLGLAGLESDSVECFKLLERTLNSRADSLHIELCDVLLDLLKSVNKESRLATYSLPPQVSMYENPANSPFSLTAMIALPAAIFSWMYSGVLLAIPVPRSRADKRISSQISSAYTKWLASATNTSICMDV